MKKPEYCKQETWDYPPCGFTRCAWCCIGDMPRQCAILNNIDTLGKEDEINHDKE